MNTDPQILKANVWGFFTLGCTRYQITGVYGQCFQCHKYENGELVGPECLISARMILGTVELTA